MGVSRGGFGKEELSALLYRHDPIYLGALGAPEDEYDTEMEIILSRLGEAGSARDVPRFVHEEFISWVTEFIPGEESRYDTAGEEIWQRLQGEGGG